MGACRRRQLLHAHGFIILEGLKFIEHSLSIIGLVDQLGMFCVPFCHRVRLKGFDHKASVGDSVGRSKAVKCKLHTKQVLEIRFSASTWIVGLLKFFLKSVALIEGGEVKVTCFFIWANACWGVKSCLNIPRYLTELNFPM